MSKAAQYILHIQPLPRRDDPDGMRRLRAALKSLLRCYSLRCTKIESPQQITDEQIGTEDEGKIDGE